MDTWMVLGIDKTKDKSLIKDRYFDLLTKVNPEDNPEFNPDLPLSRLLNKFSTIILIHEFPNYYPISHHFSFVVNLTISYLIQNH